MRFILGIETQNMNWMIRTENSPDSPFLVGIPIRAAGPRTAAEKQLLYSYLSITSISRCLEEKISRFFLQEFAPEGIPPSGEIPKKKPPSGETVPQISPLGGVPRISP